MTTKVIMPKAGMGTTEGTLISWRKSVGDPVSEGEVIAEIETAKAIQEVESPANGVLSKIFLNEGETADVHTEIAEIDEKHEHSL